MTIEQIGLLNSFEPIFIPINQIKPNQTWVGSGPIYVKVETVDVQHDLVTYSWTENDAKRFHSKDSWSFQVRYKKHE